MPSPEGRGLARAAWDAYVGATKKYVNPAIEKTPLGDAITSISANKVSDLVGFWLLWHLYGGFEGLTGAEIAQARGEDWNLWIDGVVAGATPGEHSSDVYARARAVLARVRRTVADGVNVALVAHGHILRSLGAAWVELPVIDGRKLALDTGTISILGHEHGHPAIIRWNMPPALTPAETTSSAGTPSRGTSPAPPPTTRPREE